MNFKEKKFLALRILDGFSERMGWRVFSSTMRGDLIPTSLNYIKLSEKINDLTENESNKKIIDKICKLSVQLKENIIFGEKAIRLGKVEAETVDKLKQVGQLCIERFHDTDGSWLMTKKPSLTQEETPEIIHAEEVGTGVAWFFNATRSVTSRTEIPSMAVKDEYLSSQDGSEKFYVVKETIKRCIDIVFFDPEKNIIEFRVDNAPGFSSNERFRAFHMLDVAFKSMYRNKTGKPISFKVFELFGAISKIYEMPRGDGRVVELSFVTDEGGIKRNRKRLNGGCILEEEFHKSGCLGIDNQLTPYRIARVWPYLSNKYNSEPELLLPGTLRMVSQTGSGNPVLNEFLISKVIGINDYVMVTEKLMSLISPESTGNDSSSAT